MQKINPQTITHKEHYKSISGKENQINFFIFEFSDIGQKYSQGWFLTILDVTFERPAPSVEHLMSP